MIKICDGEYFMCDECELSGNEVEYRLKLAEKYGEFQFDHCACDKVGLKFCIGGYCCDAFEYDTTKKHNGCRKTGRAYRRKATKQKKARQMNLMRYSPWYSAGHTEWGVVDGVLQPIGNHISYWSRSRREKFYKKYSNKKIRQCNDDIGCGNYYRRIFDYRWEVY